LSSGVVDSGGGGVGGGRVGGSRSSPNGVLRAVEWEGRESESEEQKNRR